MSSASSEVLAKLLTVDQFLAWAAEHPGRHELVDGRIHAMSQERAGHARAKARAFRAFEDAIARGALPCEVMPKGMTVRIDATTAYEPDASIYCGPRMLDGDIEIPHPSIVVEILSPSTGFYDRHHKLAGYVSVASIRHYLIVDLDRRKVVHHARDEDGVRTRILASGLLRLETPGLDLMIEDLLGAE